jgi:hypothetical protein
LNKKSRSRLPRSVLKTWYSTATTSTSWGSTICFTRKKKTSTDKTIINSKRRQEQTTHAQCHQQAKMCLGVWEHSQSRHLCQSLEDSSWQHSVKTTRRIRGYQNSLRPSRRQRSNISATATANLSAV